MQNYTKLNVTKPLKESIPAMQESLDSTASNFSGTAFPTENLFVGMTCYRTDSNTLYICTAVGTDGTGTWKSAVNTELGAGSAETDQDGNDIPSTYLKKEDAQNTYLKKAGDTMTGSLHLAKGQSTIYESNGGAGEVGTVIDHPNADVIRISQWNQTAGSAGAPITFNVKTGLINTAGDITSSGNITTTGNITTSGNITGGKVFNAVYNDYAEFFPRGEDTEPGDLIALRMRPDKESYGKATKSSKVVVGVQSDEFAQVIGGNVPPEGEHFLDWNLKKYIPVALAGRVHAKVKGPVKKGDYIVPSDEPGIGMAGRKSDRSVGRALETDSNTGARRIRLLVR